MISITVLADRSHWLTIRFYLNLNYLKALVMRKILFLSDGSDAAENAAGLATHMANLRLQSRVFDVDKLV